MKNFISDVFFHAYRWQPRTRLLKLQDKQFSDKTAKMQWWYYDFFSDDGLIGVLAFIPKKWWPNSQDSGISDSLVMLSLRKANGSVEQYCSALDSDLFRISDYSVRIGNCMALDYNVENGKSHHNLRFDFETISGCLEITANTPPFSALPLGTLSGMARKISFNSQWSRSQFRYVSQIPRGQVKGQLSMPGEEINFSGYAYHEQGWFDDDPHLLNNGWYWYHFLHTDCNIFGLPEGYIYVQLKDETLLGGTCLFTEKYRMINKRFENKSSSKILTGGKIEAEAKGINIEIHFDSNTNQDLIEFNSFQTTQLWNTSVVESTCSIRINDENHDFSGNAMLETCWLQKGDC